MTKRTQAETIETLVEGVGALVRAQSERPRDVSFADLKPVTPWNPTGERRTKKYKAFYQNGTKLNPDLMTTEELELFSQLKPGRYNGRQWEVIRRRDKSLDIRYPNATIHQRMELKGDAPKLLDMLQRITLEQEAQLERRKRGEIDDDDN